MVKYWGFYQTKEHGPYLLALFEKKSPVDFSRQVRTEDAGRDRRKVEAECLKRNREIAAGMGLK